MSQAIEDIQASVRNASETHAPLTIQGRGTWSSVYRHASAATELSLWNFAGVQEYVPGNLTMTVRAGTTLHEIAEIAGAENQWLPLDPYGDRSGTIGATISSCSYGPLVTGFGTPRDLVLGVEAVLGSGEVVRGGGRVVKNVAGYDLSRLLTGSWGTLGVISEVTLRLFARQEAETTIALSLPDKRNAIAEVVRGIRSAPLFPWAMEMLDPHLAAALGLDEKQTLVFRFGGNENVVSSQLTVVNSLGKTRQVENGFWPKFASIPHSWSMRVSGLPSKLMDTWDAAGQLVANADGGFRSAAPERGVVRVLFPQEVDSGKLFTALGQFAGSGGASALKIVIDAMPSLSPLASFENGRTVANGLSSGIKKVFDPNNILNPGLLPQ